MDKQSKQAHDMSAAGQEQIPLQCEYGNHWSITGRDNIHVHIEWHIHDNGNSVRVRVSSPHDGDDFHIELDQHHRHAERWLNPNFRITLLLHHEHGEMVLVCNLPLSHNEWFNGPIGKWPCHDNHALPFPDEAGNPGLDAPQEAMDIFPFLWLHPPTLAELADSVLRFIRMQDPDSLLLYTQLKSSKDATAKTGFAKSFLGSPAFIKDISDLPAPVNNFPGLRIELLALLKHCDDEDEIIALTEDLLNEPLDRFVKSKAWKSAQASIWQSLFALALAGSESQGMIATQLVDVLRTGHFLTLLQQDMLPPERYQDWRLPLEALVVFPDAVATTPLAPPTTAGSNGSWEVLGVGTLKIARQHLAGYVPGELADVVNVMPHERQERQEHLLSRRDEQEMLQGERHEQNAQDRQTSAASELRDALQEVMAAEGVARNLNNVTPSYNNLNLVLKGAWAGGNGGSAWAGNSLSQLAQQLTEKAARHLGERVSTQRGRVWQELHEQRLNNLIDNSRDERLVGVYRWVDKLMHVQVEEAGRRLVLAFLLDTPAAGWISDIAGAGAIPLQKPQPLPAFSVAQGQGYADILPSNYQAYAAQYGITDPEPPPPDTLTLAATVNRVVVGDLSILRIPEGYSATAGNVTLALADQHYTIACAIGSQTVIYPSAVAPVATLDVAVPLPASNGTSVADAKVTPPPTVTSGLSTTALSTIAGTTGAISLTVMSAAPLFGVTVEISCTRSVKTSLSTQDPLLVSWQMRSYERLLRAWENALHHYDETLALRIGKASAGHTAEVQRHVLRQECLALLAPSATPATLRTLAALFSWQDMSWHYDAGTTGSGNPWPRLMPSLASQPASERLFARFLQAASASVLLPAQPGSEAWLLFLLQFPQLWPGTPATAPLTESCLLLLEELQGPDAADHHTEKAVPLHDKHGEKHGWSVRIPTPMLYLQAGPELPGPCHNKPVKEDRNTMAGNDIIRDGTST